MKENSLTLIRKER